MASDDTHPRQRAHVGIVGAGDLMHGQALVTRARSWRAASVEGLDL